VRAITALIGAGAAATGGKRSRKRGPKAARHKEKAARRDHPGGKKTVVDYDEEAVGGAPKEGAEEARLIFRWYSKQLSL